MSHRQLQPFVLLAGLLLMTSAFACPNCSTAQAVRATVLGEGFWSHLVMVAVPFLRLGALSAWLYRIGLAPREGRQR